jgi:hypothetical protein
MAPHIPAKTLTESQINEMDDMDAREGIDDGADDLAGNQDDAGQDDGGEPAPRAARAEPSLPPSVLKRQQIIEKYRRPDTREFDGDLTRPENLYGEVADEHLEPAPDADEPGVSAEDRAAAELQPEPKKTFKLTVRGKVVEMSEDEVLARAQKVEAADSYLEESRQLLQDAKEIRAERAGRATQHPEGDNNTQDDGQVSNETDQQSRTHGPDLKSIIDEIQFGDPDKAARALAETIQRTAREVATTAANEGHVQRLIANDLKRSQDDLAAFRVANRDLAGDEIAEQVISNQVLKIYREEILGLGLDETQIPKDPKELSDYHRFYRVNGYNVSKTSDILNKAKDGFVSWRDGVSPTNSKQPARSKAEPRITVNVDRTERRQAIPQQPTRAVAPRRNEAPPATLEQSRKSAVNEMRKARGQTTS